LEILKTCVLDVQALVEMLPVGNARELKEDLNLGVKAIVTKAKPGKKLKPEICVDDILEL
jgi:hypothetical protein